MNQLTEDVDIDDTEYVKVPKDFFPESWSDDVRMDVLMAPFRPKTVNPINYDSKMLFWKTLIIKYCDVKGSAIVTECELRCAFQRNKRKPHCIFAVLEEMKIDKQIQSIDEFMTLSPDTWSDWAIGHMARPMHWGWNKIKERVWQTNETKRIQYIVIDAVKKHSEKLIKTLPLNRIISMDEFENNLTNLDVTNDGAKYAVQYLKSKHQACQVVIEINSSPHTLLKFTGTGASGKCEINESDRNVYGMKFQEKLLEKTVEELEHNVNELEDIARKYVRENKKQLARNYLRKKHNLQKQLDKKANQLDNLQKILLTLNETKHDVDMIKTLQMGSITLRKTMEENGVSIETVDDLQSDIKELLDDQQEIHETISSPIITSNYDIADDELEDELNDLLKAEEQTKLIHDDTIEQRLRQLNVNDLPSLNDSFGTGIHQQQNAEAGS